MNFEPQIVVFCLLRTWDDRLEVVHPPRWSCWVDSFPSDYNQQEQNCRNSTHRVVVLVLTHIPEEEEEEENGYVLLLVGNSCCIHDV